MSESIQNPEQRDPSSPAHLQENLQAPTQSRFLVGWITGAALVFFLCSSVRHALFQSTAFDLGIYDQVVYLISQGLPPISSFLGFHHMGNHAAWSVYPLALLYKIYPSVYWLLAVQAVCLALGALPTWLLARQAGLTRSLSQAMAIVYLLYPLVFNLNLFDFHPEVMALPAILTAIWAARAEQKILFCATTLFALGCRDALSLTIAAMGVWLLLFEKRRFYGWFALVTGLGWFVLVTQWIIPMFKGGGVAAVARYKYLGHSVLEIAQNMLLKPGLVLGKLLTWHTANYLLLVVSPVLWGLSPRHLAPLIVAVPTLVLNILSRVVTQQDLHHQYSLPVLPFLLVAVIATLSSGRGWLRSRRWIILWSLVAFLLLQKSNFLARQYVRALDSWRPSQEAIAQIQTQGGVLADIYLAPHVTHRAMVRPALPKFLPKFLSKCDYVLVNLRLYRDKDRDLFQQTVNQLKRNPEFQLTYQQDKVYLFTRKLLPKGNSAP